MSSEIKIIQSVIQAENGLQLKNKMLLLITVKM